MKTKKLLSLILLGVLSSVGNVWADTSVTFSAADMDKDSETKTKGQVTVVSLTSKSSYQQYLDGKTSKKADGIQMQSSADNNAPTVASGTGLQFSVPSGYVITAVSLVAATNDDSNSGPIVFLQWASDFDKTPDKFEQITAPNRGGSSAPAAIAPSSIISNARAFGLYKRIKVNDASTPTEIPTSSGSSYPSSSKTTVVFSVTVTYRAVGTTYSVSVETSTGTDDYGTVTATLEELEEGGTTTITATPEEGYKLGSWAVSGTGASLSSTTTNPTTLTMGTANATVTATFRALYTYDITYNAGANGTGTIAAGVKTEDTDFTLSSSRFTRDGYTQTGWSLTDGGDKAYELGAKYTGNADLNLFPYWQASNTLTYDANGGSGSMSNTVGAGTITLTANAYTKTNYTFMGWATSQANADAGTVAYADKAEYTLSANATLYAVWAANDYSWTQKTTSGTIAVGNEVEKSTGGKMIVEVATIKYASTGIEFSSSGAVSITLDKKMQVGTVITGTLYYGGTDKDDRTLYLKNSSNVTKSTWQLNPKTDEISSKTFTYTVVAGDGLDGAYVFKLVRKNNVYLTSLTVVNCEQVIRVTPAKTYTTYVTPYALDFSGLALKAYKATAATSSTVTLSEVTAVPANTPLVLKKDEAASYDVPVIASADDVEGNLLVAGDGSTTMGGDSRYDYVLVDGTFYRSNEGTVAVGKAYLRLDAAPSPSPELRIVFEENNATDIQSIEANEKVIKFVENGQLLILRDGITYDALGRVIR